MRMRGVIALAGVCMLTLGAGSGCKQNAAKDDEVQRLNKIIINQEKEIRDLMGQIDELQVRLQQSEIALDGKNRQIEALRKGMRNLRSRAVLTDKVQQQLEILADKFGGKLVGNRLELPGDFFFGSGQFQLRDTAKASLRELSGILKDEKLMLLVVGHTDSDPVVKSRRKGIRNNRHLSMMRAWSVLQELKSSGYPPLQMYATGWGELRPLATNNTKEGKALNRRVDILIDPVGSGLFSLTGITGVTPAGPGGEE